MIMELFEYKRIFASNKRCTIPSKIIIINQATNMHIVYTADKNTWECIYATLFLCIPK